MKKFVIATLLLTSFLCLNAAEAVKSELVSEQDLKKLQAFMVKSGNRSTVKESVNAAAAAVEIAMSKDKTFKPEVITKVVRWLENAGNSKTSKEQAMRAMEDSLRSSLSDLKITDTVASESAISNLEDAIRLGFKIPDDWSLRQGVTIARAREAWQSESPEKLPEQIEQDLLEYLKDFLPSDYDTLVSHFAGNVTSGLEGAVSKIEEGASSLLGPEVALIGAGLVGTGALLKTAYDKWSGPSVTQEEDEKQEAAQVKQ